MFPRRKHLGHNKDLIRLEQLLKNSKVEKQKADRARIEKSPDIQQRIEEIKKTKEELLNKEKKMDDYKVNKNAVKVDPKILDNLNEAYKSEVKPIKNMNTKKLEPEEESAEVDLSNLIIVEILEPILLSTQNSGLSKYRDIQAGEKAIYIRDSTEEEGLDLALLQFDDYVFKSILNPEKNTNEYLVSKKKFKILNDNKNNENSDFTIDQLKSIYEKYGQSLTNLGLLEFSDSFLIYIINSGADDLVHDFIDYLFEKQEIELFNSAGFLKVLDNKPLLDPDELDLLLLKFINSIEDTKTWFKQLLEN